MDEFLSAVKHGDTLKIRQIIGNEDLVGRILEMDKLLVFCATHHNEELIEQFTVLGARIDDCDELGLYPVHYCAAQNMSKALYVLAFSGAEIDQRDAMGRTPLMLAVQLGKTEAFNFLASETKEINAVDKLGDSALRIAVEKGAIGMATTLIGNKADLNIPDHLGRVPLFYAALQGNEEMVSLLIRNGANVQFKDSQGRNALSFAAAFGQRGVFDILIRAGLDIHSKDIHGNNVLHFMSGHYQENFVRYFNQGKYFSIDNTPILVRGHSIGNSSHEALRRLNSSLIGEPAGNANNKEISPSVGDVNTFNELFKYLIDRKVEMNNQQLYEDTIAQLSVLRVGDDPKNSPQRVGINSLNKTQSNNNQLKLIKQTSPSGILPSKSEHPITKETAKRKKMTSLEKPVNEVTDISKQNRNSAGVTPFLHACLTGNVKSVIKFLDDGADINQKDFRGQTGLILAASRGELGVISVLLEKKAQLEIKNHEGSTALSTAVMKGQIMSVKLLIEGGCDPKIRCKGIPILLLAISRAELAITKYLISKGLPITEKDSRGLGAKEYVIASRSAEMANYIKYLI
jgi:ankyrin repeat protein